MRPVSRNGRLKRRWFVPAALLVLALVAAGAAASMVSSHEAKELTKITIRMDYSYFPHHAGFFAAKAKGWYEQAGLDVNIQEGTGSQSTAQLVSVGKNDFGWIIGDIVVKANAKGAKLVSVAAPDQDAGFAVAYRKGEGINTPKDLKGHTYGDAPTSATATLFPIFLKNVGLNPTDVKVVAVGAAAQGPSFWSKKIDTVISNDWTPGYYANYGKLNVGFFRFRDYGVPQLGWGITTTQKMIQEQPDIVKAFVQTSMRGWAYAYAHPSEAHDMQAKIAGKKYFFSKAGTIESLRLLVRHTKNTRGKPLGWQSPKDWQASINLLRKSGDLKGAAPPISSMVTNRFIAGG